MQFHSLTLNDRPAILPFFKNLTFNICDYTPGCTLMWKDYYKVEACIEDGFFATRQCSPAGEEFYGFPLGDAKKAIHRILEEDPSPKIEFAFLPEPALELFKDIPGASEPVEMTNFFDYIYRAEDLIGLSGKKYAGQRNHIHKFLKAASSWSLEDLNEKTLPAVLEFFESSYVTANSDGGTGDAENRLVREVLSDPSAYEMFGNCLLADGKVVGFALAEHQGNTLFTHIEKADRGYPGAYQMLVNQFTKAHTLPGIEFVNREDDNGDEGLRTAKLAYHPCELAKKYKITITR